MTSLSGWSNYFQEVSRLVEEAERLYGMANNTYTEYIIERLEICLTTCSNLLRTLQLVNSQLEEDYKVSLQELNDCLKLLHRKWREYESILDSYPADAYSTVSYRAPLIRPVQLQPGRPKFEISKDQLEYLTSMGFKWNEIAALLGVSRMTVYRRRLEYGLLEDPSSGISDADLISLIRQIRMDMPYSGVSMVCGSLRARRFNITREKVRSALRSIDPLASASRWSAEITRRRPYSVAGPNSLWHIDSHHKLIRWRLITHGGIDGYSRLIVFLKCSSNNRSSTMYELFLTAVQKHQLPSRVRSDQGGENMLVAQHMIEHRGAERRSMITGSSTHNQRIERLWRDMHKSVTVLFYKLFYFMEQNDLLDHLNEIHLWALHYVFIPRINKALQEFVRSWNNHSLRTAGHKSPQQLFTAGALLLQNSQLSALDFFHQVDVNYGIDPDGPLPVSDDNDVEGVSVPETSLRFSDENMTTIRQNIDPYSYSDNYGVDLYEQTVAFISTLNPLH